MRAWECRERVGEGGSPCGRPSHTPLPSGQHGTKKAKQVVVSWREEGAGPERASLSPLTTPHKLRPEARSRKRASRRPGVSPSEQTDGRGRQLHAVVRRQQGSVRICQAQQPHRARAFVDAEPGGVPSDIPEPAGPRLVRGKQEHFIEAGANEGFRETMADRFGLERGARKALVSPAEPEGPRDVSV